MTSEPMHAVLRYLRKAAALRDAEGLTDHDLLERFVCRREEAAFEALVQRHGPMVLGLCRRVLNDAHDAEDAFQATFLVLVRRAGVVRNGGLLGPWLYGVAYRTALSARSERSRRRRHERRVAAMPEAEPAAEAAWTDLRPVLDEEVQRLPEKYRVPVVLCYLEGKTYEEAARLLGCPKGTVATRLARARGRLQVRLAGRGVALSAGLLATVLALEARATVPAALAGSTVRAGMLVAAGKAAGSARVAALAEGVMKAMVLARTKTATLLVLVLAAIATGTAVQVYRARAAEQAAAPGPQAPAAPPARAAAAGAAGQEPRAEPPAAGPAKPAEPDAAAIERLIQ
jgi:RNA polymerase sigma factor (sigma-70 family)